LASSSTRSGCTPLSDRFQATRFSQIDCQRSMANGCSFIDEESVADKELGYPSREHLMPTDLLPELALIPSSDFQMGSEDGEDDERPAHRIDVEDFYIGVCPVSHAEYARFVRETGHRAPAVYELPLVVTAGGTERERAFRTASQQYIWPDSTPPEDKGDHPVTLVRHEDAVAYCAWLATTTGRGFRLPTEVEWEKAARGGVDGKRYPWGDRLDRNMANFLARPLGEGAARHDRLPHVPAERIRAVRHDRQRLGVGARLVRCPVLRGPRPEPRGPAPRAPAGASRRQLARRGRADAVVRSSPQGPARYVLVRDWIQGGVFGVIRGATGCDRVWRGATRCGGCDRVLGCDVARRRRRACRGVRGAAPLGQN
jgi:hypothetical protein